jgi:hypothetical protein
MGFYLMNNGEGRKFRILKRHHLFEEPRYGRAFEIADWNGTTQLFVCPNCNQSKIDIDLKDITFKSSRWSTMEILNKKEYGDSWEGYKLIRCSICSSLFLIGIASHEFCNNGWYDALQIILELEEIDSI